MSAPDLAPDRRTTTLLLHQVSQADAAKARAYLQVGGHRLRRRWRAVDDGDADVMLLGSVDPQTVPGLLGDPAVTLRLLDRPDHGADARVALVRPLQYGPFIDALLAAENRLDCLDAPPSDPLDDDPSIETIPDRLASPRTVVKRSVAPVPVPEPDLPRTSQPFSLRLGDVYRLRRWPPSAMLMHKQHYARIAGYISVRHVGLEDLVHLSKTPKRHCSAFLVEMGSAGLLDARPMPPSRNQRRGEDESADTDTDTIPDADREERKAGAADSLLERMRRRFAGGAGARRGR